MNNDWFITRLNNLLPSGFEAKKFNNMPRIHIKYDNYKFYGDQKIVKYPNNILDGYDADNIRAMHDG